MNNKSNQQSIDGFVLRRRTTQGQTLNKDGLARPAIPKQFLRPHSDRSTANTTATPEILPKPQETAVASGLRRSEIDQALAEVDEQPTKKTKERRRSRFPRKKFIALLFVALVLLGIGYFVTKFVLTGGRVFSGNVFDLFGSGVQLQKDENGYSNILLFGTSEDDPGHNGASLSDSIMVLSVNQEKEKAFMFSVPRDLWVDYGQACLSGYSGKINAVYSCGAEDGDEVAGAKFLRDKVGDVFGLDIQYHVKVNYAVVRDLTTSLGGVTVVIDSSDSRGIYDSNMGSLLRLPNGPATIAGEQALAFVRARGDGYASYGFNGSNFDREKNQQKMLIAIRDKALSAGTLTNPVAINGLLDALGNNIRTNFSAAEVNTLARLAEKIPAENVRSLSLIDKTTPLVTTGSYNGQSIVRPVAGIGVFDEIQSYIKKQMVGGDIVDENASLEVLNASSKMGVAGEHAEKLKQAGLVNITTGDTSYISPSSIAWYDTSGGKKPKTLAKLANVLGKQPTTGDLPSGVQSEADFVILVGNGTD